MTAWMKTLAMGCSAVAIAFVALGLGASAANAKSCSSFAVFKSYDAATGMAEVKWQKGKARKYFPRVEGASGETSKIPKGCRRAVTKEKNFAIKPSGGRMSITQFRTNFSGKMMNDVEDKEWVGEHLSELIAAKTKVLIVVRPGMGKDAPLGITTIYMPITPEEEAEIERLNKQASDA